MSISIFISARDIQNTRTLTGHYDFAVVPSKGDIMMLFDGDDELMLRVDEVTHLPRPKGEPLDMVSHVSLYCLIVNVNKAAEQVE